MCLHVVSRSSIPSRSARSPSEREVQQRWLESMAVASNPEETCDRASISDVGVDRPVLKDWAFWHGIGWALVTGISTIIEPIKESTAPLWVDVPGVAVVTFFMIGWPVAGGRRIIRGLRARRARRRESCSPRTPLRHPLFELTESRRRRHRHRHSIRYPRRFGRPRRPVGQFQ